MSRSWTLSDRHYLFLVFTSLVFAFFVSFSFETIDNTSLLFSSSLLLRLFFSATSTSAHGPRREQRCCFFLTPLLNLSAFLCLSFSVCIVLFVLSVNAPSGARLEWVSEAHSCIHHETRNPTLLHPVLECEMDAPLIRPQYPMDAKQLNAAASDLHLRLQYAVQMTIGAFQ